MNYENGRGPVINAKNGEELYHGILEILKKGTKERKESSIKLAEPRGMSFEGLARESLFCELFSFLEFEVFVFSGFVSVGRSYINKQVDLIISYKKPEEWLTSGYHIADYNDIIAIIEVKTTLRYADFKDAFEHLGHIKEKIIADQHSFKDIQDNQKYNIDRIFNTITKGVGSPHKDVNLHNFSPFEACVYEIIYKELTLPLTFILAFSGYSSEDGFHRAFTRILDENYYRARVDVMPTLICTEKYSISKSLVYPFAAAGKGHFNMITASTDPLLMIFRSITSKIAMEKGLREMQEHRFKEIMPRFDQFVQFQFSEDPEISINYVSDLNLIKKKKQSGGFKVNGSEPARLSQEQIDWLIYCLVTHSFYRGKAIVLYFRQAIENILPLGAASDVERKCLNYMLKLSSEILRFDFLIPRTDDFSVELWGGIIVFECRDGFYISSLDSPAQPKEIINSYTLEIDGDYIVFSSEKFYHSVMTRLNTRLYGKAGSGFDAWESSAVGKPKRI